MYRECCYDCKYANTNRIGDITLADFWGIEQVNPKFYSEQGVSLVFINTKKGNKIFNDIKENIVYNEQTIEEASRKNGNLMHPTKRTAKRDSIYSGIDNKKAKDFVKVNLKIDGKLKKKIKKLIPKKLKKIIKRVI